MAFFLQMLTTLKNTCQDFSRYCVELIINFAMNMEAKILIMITMMCYEEVSL